MVRSAGHGADPVETSRETSGDIGREQSLTVSVIVDTLEEGKGLWVGRSAGCEVIPEVLDGDVSMTDDVAALKSLRSSVVGVGGVGEGTRDQVLGLDLDAESGVGVNVLTGRRKDDNRRDHVVVGGDVTHDDTVARSCRHLKTVGQCLPAAEVDEVGRVTCCLC